MEQRFETWFNVNQKLFETEPQFYVKCQDSRGQFFGEVIRELSRLTKAARDRSRTAGKKNTYVGQGEENGDNHECFFASGRFC